MISTLGMGKWVRKVHSFSKVIYYVVWCGSKEVRVHIVYSNAWLLHSPLGINCSPFPIKWSSISLTRACKTLCVLTYNFCPHLMSFSFFVYVYTLFFNNIELIAIHSAFFSSSPFLMLIISAKHSSHFSLIHACGLLPR